MKIKPTIMAIAFVAALLGLLPTLGQAAQQLNSCCAPGADCCSADADCCN